MSTAYLTQGAGKRSIALDLGDEADFETMLGLLSVADVFVENHRPETMTRLGLDEARLSQKISASDPLCNDGLWSRWPTGKHLCL